MAAPSQSGAPPDELPPYRSYKETRSDGIVVVFSPAAKRLFWPLDGVFPNGITVMNASQRYDDVEPYFQQTTGAWHEIAQLPLTEPKVSSIEASVFDFHDWEYNWLYWHGSHEGDRANPEWVTYGDLSDEDRPYATEAKEDGSWEEDSDTEFLIACCGEDRPLRKTEQKLVVMPSAGNDFVTVHDYISAVHPWLINLRSDILRAKASVGYQPSSDFAGMTWIVDTGPAHRFTEKQHWIRRHGGSVPPAIAASNAAILARIRASRGR